MASAFHKRTVDEIVGENIRRVRLNAGLSLYYVVQHIGGSVSELEQIENGTLRAGAARIVALSNFIGVTPSIFFHDPSLIDGHRVKYSNVFNS